MKINLYFRLSIDFLLENLLFALKKISKCEAELKMKIKEIKKLEYLNKCLINSNEKRDTMIAFALEENRRLKNSNSINGNDNCNKKKYNIKVNKQFLTKQKESFDNKESSPLLSDISKKKKMSKKNSVGKSILIKNFSNNSKTSI